MDILPIINSSKRLGTLFLALLLVRSSVGSGGPDNGTEVNGESTDEVECVRVRSCRLEAKELGRGVLDQVERG